MIIKLLLLEHRIVFVCTYTHELTPVCELFASLLFPLRWRHLFIPLLSRHMAEALKNMNDYKEPFLVGLPRFVYVRPEISSNMPPQTCIVFLDIAKLIKVMHNNRETRSTGMNETSSR